MTAPAWTGFDEAVAAYQRGDYATAIRKFRPLAEQGNAKAQFNLGIMYDNGQGVPQDFVQAYMWLKLAFSTFPPGEKRDKAVKNRDIVAEKMTPAQISEAQKLAREWRPKKGRVPGRPVANLHREENHDHTENHIRGPRACRRAVRRVHIGPDGTGLGEFG